LLELPLLLPRSCPALRFDRMLLPPLDREGLDLPLALDFERLELGDSFDRERLLDLAIVFSFSLKPCYPGMPRGNSRGLGATRPT
jgi:hypothetical protein